MDSKVNNSNNIKEVNWKYFSDICQVSIYLARNDIIQLSSTCKQLRLKFKSKLLSKLELMREGKIISGKPNKLSKKKQLISLFDILEEDYLDKHKFVNHCIIWVFFNSRFARNFFSLFSNITRLELYVGNTGNCYNYNSIKDTIGSNTVLIEALYPLKNLEYLAIDSELICSWKSRSRLYLKLPLCLKSLIIIDSESVQKYFKFYPVENINEEYTDLKTVTIIKGRMLSNMMATMKSLTDVTILSRQRFSLEKLAKFLLLNPQLEKLTAPVYFLERDLVNSILQLKRLKQLNIKYSPFESSVDISNYSVNTSIEYLSIDCDISSDRLVPFLNNLKCLKVLEVSSNSFFNFMNIEFSAITNRIQTLHLKSLVYAEDAFYLLDNPEIFDRIRFTNMFDLKNYLTNFGGEILKKWKIYNSDPADSTDFMLVRIENL